jgi:hypothetical protein
VAQSMLTIPGIASAIRFPLGRGGSRNVHLRRHVSAFRRAVEAAVIAAKGEIGIVDASLIHSASVALRQHLRLELILAVAGQPGEAGEGKLAYGEWLAVSDRLLKAKESVDRCLERLRLDVKPDPWDVLGTFAGASGEIPQMQPVAPTGSASVEK